MKPSGRAAQIEVSSTTGERLQLSAASFRFAVNRSLGWNRLRSDLYTVQMGAGGRIEFDGKGYGHGVGLSQSGARRMATEGRDERAILHFYFPGTTVRIEAGDEGWHVHEGAGWTLVSTDLPAEDIILRASDTAWRKAQSLLGSDAGPNGPHPTVRVFPTTELFRGVANQPGWTLGVTRNQQISLQSPQIVARNNPRPNAFGDLLFHEMLHVCLEATTSSPLPLWFREGLVEVLTAEHPLRPLNRSPRRSRVEQQLDHPASLAEADRGHREAALLVQRLVDLYGMRTVRTWLSSGIPPEAETQTGLP